MNSVFWIPQTPRAVQQQKRKLNRMVLCRLCVACWLGKGKSGLHGSKKAKEIAWMCLERERHCKTNKLNSSNTETMLANKMVFRCAFLDVHLGRQCRPAFLSAPWENTGAIKKNISKLCLEREGTWKCPFQSLHHEKPNFSHVKMAQTYH